MNAKTYSSKSNAKRAAIAANGSIDGMELLGSDGAWYYDHVRVVQVVEKAPKAKAKKQVAAATPAPKAPRAKKAGTYAQLQASSAGTNSSVENPVRAMWDLCDAMTGSKRKDVIAAAVEQGINYYTARTQYQLWLTAWRNSNPTK